MAAVEMNPRQKIGLFGGSFDPIHHGHLILARDAMEQLGLEKVIFIPANISPHKLDHPPAPAHARCEMVAAAIVEEPRFALDSCEVDREGISFAVDTVRLMIQRHPEADFFYFIGEDNLAALHKLTWHLHRSIDFHGHVRRERVIGTPLVHGPNEIRTSGRRFQCVHDHDEILMLLK